MADLLVFRYHSHAAGGVVTLIMLASHGTAAHPANSSRSRYGASADLAT